MSQDSSDTRRTPKLGQGRLRRVAYLVVGSDEPYPFGRCQVWGVSVGIWTVGFWDGATTACLLLVCIVVLGWW